jgi:hypothetical protein
LKDVCSDPPDDNPTKVPEAVTPPKSIIADNQSVRRTVILRISSSADLATLAEDITAAGCTTVSDGVGVIVIEGTGQAIEKLRQHQHVISIEEPQRLQMRRPSGTRGNDDS